MTLTQKTNIAIAHIEAGSAKKATKKQIEKFLKYPDQVIVNLAKRLGL